jgi:gamma-glutamyltranspeptidase / glutathione hydrolase
LLNDEMDDFSAKPGSPNGFGLVQGEANAIAPGKRPLSSMTPTILTKDGKLFLILGAPGGSTIINGVLEMMLNVVDFGMNIQDAIDRPRFHQQWLPDKLFVEDGISPDTIALLRERGYRVAPMHELVPELDFVAEVEAIEVKDGDLQGAYDGRATGKVAGIN